MGMRPWKVNTVLSLDGFRICIAGTGSGGKCLVAQPIVQFASSQEWSDYLKAIERFDEKIKRNPNHVYDEKYDVVSKKMNIEMYDMYVDKHKNSIFRKRVNSPVGILENGREKFCELALSEQCKALRSIHETFGKVSGGCDLSLIGGASKAAATVSFSSTVSNWKKNYTDVRIVDCSTSGLWEKYSKNILELL